MMRIWLKSYPVLAYFALVFTISRVGIFIAAGPGRLFNSKAAP